MIQSIGAVLSKQCYRAWRVGYVWRFSNGGSTFVPQFQNLFWIPPLFSRTVANRHKNSDWRPSLARCWTEVLWKRCIFLENAYGDIYALCQKWWPVAVHPCLDYPLMDYSRLDYLWLDYKDSWTNGLSAFGLPMTFGLPPFGLQTTWTTPNWTTYDVRTTAFRTTPQIDYTVIGTTSV